jgi:hypothetical protein
MLLSNEEDNPGDVGLSPQEQERVARIGDELREGIESLKGIGPAVSIFGSAHSQPESWEYQSARQLAKTLSAEGIAVVTGGGPGVMEAANLGAREEVGTSVGLNIELPHEQWANPYLDIDFELVGNSDQAAAILLESYPRECG